ncbi:MAG: hypothetical protein EA369_09930 [Bradymonadales bacterium]|nr:MAG: hypothetical protein EA369_09930 [Bradymonadales bacterium]
MEELLNSSERREDLWTQSFEGLVDFFSKGEFEKELMRAKSIFFSKLGRTYEMEESFYNAVSQSFLEWYLFDYCLAGRQKSPAILSFSLDRGSEAERGWLKASIFHHLSVFEVRKILPGEIVLRDLLFSVERRVRKRKEDGLFQSWRAELHQIVQARLFPVESGSNQYFATHIWLHPETEYKKLRDLCRQYSEVWGLHREMLRELLECLIRSYDLSDQLAVLRSQNWLYRDFYKKYLKGEATDATQK